MAWLYAQTHDQGARAPIIRQNWCRARAYRRRDGPVGVMAVMAVQPSPLIAVFQLNQRAGRIAVCAGHCVRHGHCENGGKGKREYREPQADSEHLFDGYNRFGLPRLLYRKK